MLIRSSDGQLLIVSSSDGFCSIICFSKEDLGVPYTDNVTIKIHPEESVVQDVEDVLNKDTPLKINQTEDISEPLTKVDNISEPPTKVDISEPHTKIDISEPPTKKRVQLVTLSSPKTKKYLNK